MTGVSGALLAWSAPGLSEGAGVLVSLVAGLDVVAGAGVPVGSEVLAGVGVPLLVVVVVVGVGVLVGLEVVVGVGVGVEDVPDVQVTELPSGDRTQTIEDPVLDGGVVEVPEGTDDPEPGCGVPVVGLVTGVVTWMVVVDGVPPSVVPASVVPPVRVTAVAPLCSAPLVPAVPAPTVDVAWKRTPGSGTKKPCSTSPSLAGVLSGVVVGGAGACAVVGSSAVGAEAVVPEVDWARAASAGATMPPSPKTRAVAEIVTMARRVRGAAPDVSRRVAKMRAKELTGLLAGRPHERSGGSAGEAWPSHQDEGIPVHPFLSPVSAKIVSGRSGAGAVRRCTCR